MPFTFSHPAAVLPVHSRFKNWIPLSALVIGSLVPDAARNIFHVASARHSGVASFLLARSVSGIFATQPAPRGHRAPAQAPFSFHSAGLGRGIGDSDWRMEPCSMGFVHALTRLDRAARSAAAKAALRKRDTRVQRPAV